MLTPVKIKAPKPIKTLLPTLILLVISKSGIIISQEKEVKGSDKDSRSEITHINGHNELKVGDIVMLPTYANYEIKLSEKQTVWCVESKLILGKYGKEN